MKQVAETKIESLSRGAGGEASTVAVEVLTRGARGEISETRVEALTRSNGGEIAEVKVEAMTQEIIDPYLRSACIVMEVEPKSLRAALLKQGAGNNSLKSLVPSPRY